MRVEKKKILDEIKKLLGKREREEGSLFPTMRYFPRLHYCAEWGLLFHIKVKGEDAKEEGCLSYKVTPLSKYMYISVYLLILG